MRTYDFALGWESAVKEDFIEFLIAECKIKELSFLWVSEQNIREVIGDLERNKLRIKVLLDTAATYNKPKDVYARLSYAVKDAGGAVINDPDRARIAIDKSAMHYELLNVGIEVPYTVIVRNWEPNNFKLTSEERNKLGVPFIIKPALGYGQLGVIRNAKGSINEIAAARNFDRGDNFLLQEKILPVTLENKKAWFRIIHVFDTIIPCWWDDQTSEYVHVGYEEFNNNRLFQLVKIVAKIASMTKMVWFSTEIAIDKKNDKLRFVTIDYVNDQCDMTTKREVPNGIPDNIVEHTANTIVDVANKCINREKISRKYTILLKDAVVEIKGLGNTQSIMDEMLHHQHFS
ncbi:MAG: hypothetical protein ABH857_04170 [Elusimicrobiota bacterium]